MKKKILDFDDVRFTVTLLMFIGMTWEERRLIGPTDNTSSMATVDNSFSEFLWLPGVNFINIFGAAFTRTDPKSLKGY